MIIVKSDSEIEIMRKSGKILGTLLNELETFIKPGMSTKEIDHFADDFIRSHNSIPSFKGYGGFPGSLCISINEKLIHGIPSKKEIVNEGDIISVDGGVFYRGFHADAARTFIIGEVDEEIKRLVRVTEESFFKGINQAKVGNKLYDISAAIGKHIKDNGFYYVREYSGHGIGRDLHEDPSIPNYGKKNSGPKIQKNMTFAIEPMVLMKSERVKTLSDGWTVVSTNGLYTSHYENTVLITDGEPEILTLL